jgi:dTDP-4-dehydrorhamnose reductase
MGAVDYLVTGAAGQLGRALLAAARARGRSVLGTDVATMPLDQRAAIQRAIGDARPRAVLHCGAITNVDGCEHDALAAFRVNALGTAWVAEAAAAAGAALLYVSSDFVFDGSTAGVPYAVDATPRPLSIYGASKRLGEEAVLAHARPDFHVVRASWLFGPGGRNFVRAILDRARAGQPLKVVTDQIGRPTFAPDLADALLDLAEAKAPGGIWHAANDGQCSWHEFAVEIVRAAGLDVAIGTQTAAEHAAGLAAAGRPAPAPRPAWSVLDTQKLTALRGRPLPPWRDALRRHLPLDAQRNTESRPAPDQGLRSKQY